MNLELFNNLKKEPTTKSFVENFIHELGDFLANINKKSSEEEISENKKEDHLYLVTEDRNGEIYLWDYTEKAESEFKETIESEELLNVAKEGAMLQYKNGEYVLYSPYGYDIVENSKEE